MAGVCDVMVWDMKESCRGVRDMGVYNVTVWSI